MGLQPVHIIHGPIHRAYKMNTRTSFGRMSERQINKNVLTGVSNFELYIYIQNTAILQANKREDNEDSYVKRFSGEGGIHFCEQESTILPFDKREYHAGKMNNLLFKYRDGKGKANYLPSLTTSDDVRRCFVQELSLLRRAAIRSNYTSTGDVVLITLKDIRLRMGLIDRTLNAIESKSFDSYFHTYIDTQCLSLSISHMLKKSDDFTDILNDIMEDMVLLANNIFEKYKENGDLKTNTPFRCHCHRQLWLILAKIYDCCKYVPESMFDKLSRLLDNKWKSSNLFRLWLFRHLHNLDLYNTAGAYDSKRTTDPTSRDLLRNQYGYLQDTFSRITSSKNATELLPSLKLTYLFMTDTWMVNTSIIMYKTIWEHFYKKMSTGAVKFVIPDTVGELLSLRMRLISFADPPVIVNAHNALLLFLQMLMNHLHKFPDDWQKLKSRFYTRFLPERMSQFHVSVINTVAFIYLILTETNFNELSTKLLAVLKALQTHTNTQHVSLWNFNIAVILLHVQKEKNIRECADSFMLLVNASLIDNRLHLITKFVSHFKMILNSSNDPSKLALHKLIDVKWISTYMDRCSCVELMDLISLMEKIVDVSGPDNTQLWLTLENVLRTQILLQIEEIAGARPEAPANIGLLAAKIAIRSTEFRSSIIQFYTSHKICNNSSICGLFISELLQSYPDKVTLSLSQERLLVQAWVRCMLIPSANNTGCIFKLQSLSPLIPKDHQINNWTLTDMRRRLRELIELDGCTKELRELVIHCFGNVDTSVGILLDRMRAHHEERLELIQPIRTLLEEVGSMIEDCGSLLHKNNEPGSKLERLLAVTLLSHNAMSSPNISSGWLHAVQTVWTKYYNGLRTVRTKMQQEKSSIDRMLHDLIVRYVRHYSVEQSPIVHTLFLNIDEELEYILHHLSSELNRFPTQDERKQVINIIHYVYERIEHSTPERKEIVVRSAVPALLELMLTNNESLRSESLTLLNKMSVNTVNSHFAITVGGLVEIARSQLMFHGAQVLSLLKYLTPKLVNVVNGALDGVERNIVEVERRQGVQRNNMLRNLFEDVQKSLPQYHS